MKDNVLPDTCTFTSIFSVGLFMFACFGQSMRQVPLPRTDFHLWCEPRIVLIGSGSIMVSQFTVNDHVYALDTIAMEWRRVQPGGPVQPLSRDMYVLCSSAGLARRCYLPSASLLSLRLCQGLGDGGGRSGVLHGRQLRGPPRGPQLLRARLPSLPQTVGNLSSTAFVFDFGAAQQGCVAKIRGLLVDTQCV